MNQLTVRRLITGPWLLVLLVGLLASQVDASNRERSGRQHHQQLNKNHHHHKRNNGARQTTAAPTTGADVESATVTDATSAPQPSPPGAHSSYRHRPVADVAKKMIAVKASLNGNIFMRCPIEEDMNDDEFQVSWVRLPDWRIVASGRRIYNKDERFRVLHVDGTTEWTLQIKYAALIDEGLYECQVSTATGIVTYYYNVSVIVPTTTIVGGSEYHVDKGSAIQLTCVIHNIPHEPQFIFWYHNERMINYDSESVDADADHEPEADQTPGVRRTGRGRHRPRVEVLTESEQPGGEAQNDADYQDRIVYSQLTIHDVTDADSGNYTCSPSDAGPASMLVFVSEGDDAAAAIQVGETNDSDAVLNLPASGSASSSGVAASTAGASVVRSGGSAPLCVALACLLCYSVYRYLTCR